MNRLGLGAGTLNAQDNGDTRIKIFMIPKLKIGYYYLRRI